MRKNCKTNKRMRKPPAIPRAMGRTDQVIFHLSFYLPIFVIFFFFLFSQSIPLPSPNWLLASWSFQLDYLQSIDSTLRYFLSVDIGAWCPLENIHFWQIALEFRAKKKQANRNIHKSWFVAGERKNRIAFIQKFKTKMWRFENEK